MVTPAGKVGGSGAVPEVKSSGTSEIKGGTEVHLAGTKGDTRVTVYFIADRLQLPKGGVSATAGHMVQLLREKRPGTPEYYEKNGLMEVKTSKGAIYMSEGDLNKARAAGVYMPGVDIAKAHEETVKGDAMEKAVADSEASHKASVAAKHRGLTGSHSAGHTTHSASRFKAKP